MASLAGSFLVARSTLFDPNFRETVVLLIQHSAEGALGLVVNRKAQVTSAPFPVFVGGPCESEGLLMIHGHEEWLDEEEREQREIAPGIFMGDASCVDRVTSAELDEDLRYRIVVGYSGWGPDQLESEMVMQQSSWSVVPADGDTLFNTPVEELWSTLAPPAFPEPSVN